MDAERSSSLWPARRVAGRGALVLAFSLAALAGISPGGEAHLRGRDAGPLAGAARVRALAMVASGGSAIVRATSLRPGDGGYALVSTGTIGSVAVRAAAHRCAGLSRLDLRVDGFTLPALALPRDGAARRIGLRLLLGAGDHRVFVRAHGRGRGCALRLRSFALRRPAVPLGAAVRQDALASAAYVQAFDQDFDSMTPENELKMDHLEPRQNVFAFKGADALLSFARATGKQVRGHVLVWGYALPDWLTRQLVPFDRSQASSILEHYIKTVVQHFAGRVYEWDVVNEAFDANGHYVPNYWFQKLGPSYIPLAFRWAHEADPNVRLVYNDIGAEAPGPHLDAIVSMVHSLRQQGIRIDAVGFQNHVLGLPPVPGRLAQSLRAVAAEHVHVEITEMDVPLALGVVGGGIGGYQARVYGDAAQACSDLPACDRFTVWGVSDQWSWLGPLATATLLDSGYQPKPAYVAVRNALAVR